MDTRRWWNPGLPQTLQGAVIFLYIDAFFAIVSVSIVGIVLGIGYALAANGLVNERRWGVALALALSALGFLLALAYGGVVAIILAIVRLAFLLHPQSREYQRVWFK